MMTMNKNKEQSLNKHLELTPEAEIRRLNAVIEQKNKTIEAFKKYDAERKAYYRHFEANYKLMEEEFNQFVEKVRVDANDDTARQISKMFTSFKNGKYGEKYCVLEGLMRSALVKVVPLEDKVHKLLESEPVMLAWCDKSELRIMVDKIYQQFEKIKEVLSNGVCSKGKG